VSLMTSYQPQPAADLAVNLFRERDSYDPRPHPLRPWQVSYQPDGGWNRWTRQPARIHWLEGDHWSILKPPAVAALAKAIRQAMDKSA